MNKSKKVLCIIVMTHQDVSEILQPCKHPLSLSSTCVCSDAIRVRPAYSTPACYTCAELWVQLHGLLQAWHLASRYHHMPCLLQDVPAFRQRQNTWRQLLQQGWWLHAAKQMMQRIRRQEGQHYIWYYCHELRTFAPLGLSNFVPPFLATMKVPSIKHSDRSIPPRSCRSVASAWSIFSNIPVRTHCWNLLWHVWYGGYLSFGMSCHGAPVRRIHRMPSIMSRASFHGLPLPSGRRGGSGISGWIMDHCSSVKSIVTPG